MTFKYQAYLSKILNCPPDHCIQKNMAAFRFVFEDLGHKNNFLPVLLIKPERQNDASFKNNNTKLCSGYAISLYDSLEHAKNQYLKLRKTSSGKFHETIGTHIAEGVLTEDDGVISSINKEGHFDLHEFEQVDLKSKFHLVLGMEA